MRIHQLIAYILTLSLIFCSAAAEAMPAQTLRLVFDYEGSVKSNEEIPPMGLKILRSEILSVTFLDSLKDAPSSAVDYSANHNGSVLAWAVPHGDLYDVFVAAEGGVIANENSSYLFYCYTSLVEVNFNGCFDMFNTTGVVSMFENCKSLTEMDMSELDFSSVKNASFMFAGCEKLKSVTLSNFDRESADTTHMFGDIAVKEKPSEESKSAMNEYPCSGCGKLEQFPFKPRGVMPVYCRDCWNNLFG